MRNRIGNLLQQCAVSTCGSLLLLALLLGAPAQAKDESMSKELLQPAFSVVTIRVPAEYEIRAASRDAVTISAEPKVVAAFKAQVRGDNLILDSTSFQTVKPVKVLIEAKNLKGLSVTSSATIVVQALSTERFSLDSDSSADIAIKSIATDRFKLVTSGSENVSISGKTRLLELSADGSGEINAGALDAQSVIAKAAGSTTAHVRASGDLQITASDSSTIKYRGNARIKKQVTDVAEVTRVN
jgi:Putative auto-transporter adhesin, head GIN domain